jgi:hypothetical protein
MSATRLASGPAIKRTTVPSANSNASCSDVSPCDSKIVARIARHPAGARNQDGVMNLTLRHFPEETKGAAVAQTGRPCITSDSWWKRERIEQEIKKHGGEFFMQLPNLDVGVARTDHHPVVAVEQQIAEVMAAIEVGESRPEQGMVLHHPKELLLCLTDGNSDPGMLSRQT